MEKKWTHDLPPQQEEELEQKLKEQTIGQDDHFDDDLAMHENIHGTLGDFMEKEHVPMYKDIQKAFSKVLKDLIVVQEALVNVKRVQEKVGDELTELSRLRDSLLDNFSKAQKIGTEEDLKDMKQELDQYVVMLSGVIDTVEAQKLLSDAEALVLEKERDDAEKEYLQVKRQYAARLLDSKPNLN